MKFLKEFCKLMAWAVGGFLFMLGLINVLAWIFSKSVALWLSWLILCIGWIGYVAFTVSKLEK